MKNTFGTSVAVTLFGESHGAMIGAVLDGMAPGIPVDEEFIASRMDLRRSVNALSTARREADAVKIVSGVVDGKTTGTPITFLIENGDTKSQHYDVLSAVARPGHADYTAYCKYHGYAYLVFAHPEMSLKDCIKRHRNCKKPGKEALRLTWVSLGRGILGALLVWIPLFLHTLPSLMLSWAVYDRDLFDR